jgi:broad specificity phosphatase PhoE
MALILLARHGETDWNLTGRIMGCSPIPLNETGERQVQALARELKRLPPDYIYASPAVRTLQTARIIGTALNLPVQVDAGLVEIGVGEWEGRHWRDLSDDPTRLQYYSHPNTARPPGGETLNEVGRRALGVVERANTTSASSTYLLISHADVIRTILAYYLGLEMEAVRHIRIDHASLTGLNVGGPQPELLYVNRVAT